MPEALKSLGASDFAHHFDFAGVEMRMAEHLSKSEIPEVHTYECSEIDGWRVVGEYKGRRAQYTIHRKELVLSPSIDVVAVEIKKAYDWIQRELEIPPEKMPSGTLLGKPIITKELEEARSFKFLPVRTGRMTSSMPKFVPKDDFYDTKLGETYPIDMSEDVAEDVLDEFKGKYPKLTEAMDRIKKNTWLISELNIGECFCWEDAYYIVLELPDSVGIGLAQKATGDKIPFAKTEEVKKVHQDAFLRVEAEYRTVKETIATLGGSLNEYQQGQMADDFCKHSVVIFDSIGDATPRHHKRTAPRAGGETLSPDSIRERLGDLHRAAASGLGVPASILGAGDVEPEASGLADGRDSDRS